MTQTKRTHDAAIAACVLAASAAGAAAAEVSSLSLEPITPVANPSANVLRISDSLDGGTTAGRLSFAIPTEDYRLPAPSGGDACEIAFDLFVAVPFAALSERYGGFLGNEGVQTFTTLDASEIGDLPLGEWVRVSRTIEVSEDGDGGNDSVWEGTVDLRFLIDPTVAGRTFDVYIDNFQVVGASAIYQNLTFESDAIGSVEPGIRHRANSGIERDLTVFEVVPNPAPSGGTRYEVGELSGRQDNGDTWYPVKFENRYENPVVVLGPPSFSGNQPATIRVRNVGSDGFEYQIDEWDYLDGGHLSETLSFMVLEAGRHTIGGRTWEAGIFKGVTHHVSSRSFSEPFDSVPSVFTQVASDNDPSAAAERIRSVSEVSLLVELDEEEGGDQGHGGEDVHYFAVGGGVGMISEPGLLFEIGSTGDTVTHEWESIAFGASHGGDPFFLANMQTRDGSDTATLRYRSLSGDGVDLFVEEETSRDEETGHTTEEVAYLTISSFPDSDRDGLPDEWEVANGLDPENPSDAMADADGDGETNLVEFQKGSDPGVGSDPGADVLVAVAAPDRRAFEKGGNPARFEITVGGNTGGATVFFSFTDTPDPNQASASANDYTVEDGDGNILDGFVVVPPGQSVVPVYIRPVQDRRREFPETVRLTLDAHSDYTFGDTRSAEITIADATDSAANETLLVATLNAERGADTPATGLATLVMNGSNTEARVSLSFNGLTSVQTTGHIHRTNAAGNDSLAGPILESVPLGQFTDHIWELRPTAGFNVREIVDSIYSQNGSPVYINVHSANYPAGEIWGRFTVQEGNSEPVVPGAPPAIVEERGEDLEREVARFLTQATFGATEQGISAMLQRVSAAGGDRIAAFENWIDEQFDLDPTLVVPYLDAVSAEDLAHGGRGGLAQSIGNPYMTMQPQVYDQLRHRIAFALSQIVVVSNALEALRQRGWSTGSFYDMLLRNADGNYRDVLYDTSRHPMMGYYLSHLSNSKEQVDPATGRVIVSPDENYAREIMQLFSIGLVERHLDGTLRLGPDGLPIQTYTNEDIKELSRVMTGWTLGVYFADTDGDGVREILPSGPPYYQAHQFYRYLPSIEESRVVLSTPMTNFPNYHDQGVKRFLGGTVPAGGTGESDLQDALDIIYNHPNVAPFVSRLLIQRLVTSNPSAGYLYRVASVFEDNGEGERGDLRAVVKAILLDYEARTLEIADRYVGFGKQKEPFIRFCQVLRLLRASSDIPLASLSAHGYPASQLDNFPAGATRFRLDRPHARIGFAGQNPQLPHMAPSVFNWFLPDFVPQGDLAKAGLFAPEFTNTSENTVVQSVNTHQRFIDDGAFLNSPLEGFPTGAEGVAPDSARLRQIYNRAPGEADQKAEALVDHLDLILNMGQLKASFGSAAVPNPRSEIISAIASSSNAGRIANAVYLMTSSPTFVTQR